MRKASKHVQPHPLEFRADAMRLVRTSGKLRSEIAQDLGLTSETLLTRAYYPCVVLTAHRAE